MSIHNLNLQCPHNDNLQCRGIRSNIVLHNVFNNRCTPCVRICQSSHSLWKLLSIPNHMSSLFLPTFTSSIFYLLLPQSMHEFHFIIIDDRASCIEVINKKMLDALRAFHCGRDAQNIFERNAATLENKMHPRQSIIISKLTLDNLNPQSTISITILLTILISNERAPPR
jgi:hypothetical protein